MPRLRNILTTTGKAETMGTHEYKCNLGVERIGHIQNVIEGQGSDVVYVMKSACGKTHVLSGRLLKTLKRKEVIEPKADDPCDN